MAKEPAHPTRRDPADRKRQALLAAGVATGIGSAALVAALLYARSHKPRDAEPKSPSPVSPAETD